MKGRPKWGFYVDCNKVGLPDEFTRKIEIIGRAVFFLGPLKGSKSYNYDLRLKLTLNRKMLNTKVVDNEKIYNFCERHFPT